ncbi:hypothetical protein X801_00757 [Opisthorchis viverrini]|uniref:Uncharacterized protein n=1 Tax=Opisthorchis viverrini TaxID=6198 RepID=A0A1S8X9B1_OPIVI|nr:hypothetical protein X801_00757 [Opisthorchis viverrini]
MQELAGRCRLETIDPSSGDAMKGIKPMGPNASKRYRRTIIFVYVLWIAMESSNFESQTLDVDFLFMRKRPFKMASVSFVDEGLPGSKALNSATNEVI